MTSTNKDEFYFKYDNVPSVKAMVDDIMEFITAETRRITSEQHINDPNYVMFIGDQMMITIIQNVLLRMHDLKSGYVDIICDKFDRRKPPI